MDLYWKTSRSCCEKNNDIEQYWVLKNTFVEGEVAKIFLHFQSARPKLKLIEISLSDQKVFIQTLLESLDSVLNQRTRAIYVAQ